MLTVEGNAQTWTLTYFHINIYTHNYIYILTYTFNLIYFYTFNYTNTYYDNVINWLKSYLTNRTSYVSLGNCRSTTVCCVTGVPQGSVLGPLLFSIFTTPVGRLISGFNISYHQYADDTQLYTSVDLSSSADVTRLSLYASPSGIFRTASC